MVTHEAEYFGFSHGFQPARSAHDAQDVLAYGIERRRISWIVDTDIRAFFDQIDHKWLVRFLGHRIGDRRLIRLIIKLLNLGVMEDGEWKDSLLGTPQGAIMSPILANTYLHYVLDFWFHRRWRPRAAHGEMMMVRYADDLVMCFQYRQEAEQFLCDLKSRLKRFGLDLHPNKTRVVEFGRHVWGNLKARGEGRPETFDFLGFTHYCRKTRDGKFGRGRKPFARRIYRTLNRIRQVLIRRMHHDVYVVARWLGRVIRGRLNYYTVPTSAQSLSSFVQAIRRMWLKVLRRRSQKDRFTWEHLKRVTKACWSPVRIVHPWPCKRFAVKLSRQEPYALTRTYRFVRRSAVYALPYSKR